MAHVPAAVTSLNNLTVELPHASLAVGAVNDGVAVHSIVVFAPAEPIVGGVVSSILVVAGDSLQAAIVLAVPAGMEPQAALVTYLVFIL